MQDKVEAVLRPIWQRKIGPYIPSKFPRSSPLRPPACRLSCWCPDVPPGRTCDPADGHELWCYLHEHSVPGVAKHVGGYNDLVRCGSSPKRTK